MSIDFTPGMINTYHGDIYNRTTDTDNVKTPDTPMWPCDNREEQQPINSTFSGEGQFAIHVGERGFIYFHRVAAVPGFVRIRM